MFTRIVEVTAKNGKSKEVCTTIAEKILPILKNQQGFVDEITLVSSDDPNRVVALSFWKTREDAERYNREQFTNVTNTIKPLVERDPVVRTYDVDTSTTHRIARGKAA